MVAPDDNTREKLEISRDIYEDEPPGPDFDVIIKRSNHRLLKDVKTSRRRGVRSLIASAFPALTGAAVAALTNFTWGGESSVARILTILGALTVITLGSSIGFFLSTLRTQQTRKTLIKMLGQSAGAFRNGSSDAGRQDGELK